MSKYVQREVLRDGLMGLAYESYRYLVRPICFIAVYSKRLAAAFQAVGWSIEP